MDLEQEFKKETGFDAYIDNNLEPKIPMGYYVEWLEAKINYASSSTQLKEKEILSFEEWKLIKFSYNNGLYNDLENPRRFYTQNKIYKKYQKEVLNL